MDSRNGVWMPLCASVLAAMGVVALRAFRVVLTASDAIARTFRRRPS